MKKTLIGVVSLALCILFALMCFTACDNAGSKTETKAESPEGMYYTKTIDGKTVEEALQESLKDSGYTMEEFMKEAGISSPEEIVTIELKSGNVAVFNVNMFKSVSEGTWRQDGNKIYITVDGQEKPFTLNGKELSNDEGTPKYVLIKK